MTAGSPRTLLADLGACIGADVVVQGWVKAIRDQKKVQFIILRDRTGAAQATLSRSDEHAVLNAAISGLTRESTVTIWGRVVANPVVKMGGLEIQITDLRVESVADPLLPLDVSAAEEANPETRLNWRFLDLRRPENLLIFRVETAVERAMRAVWADEAFIEIHSPKLMGSPSESGAELFSLEYFGRPAYLAQSPQFFKQMAMAAGFDRVFEIGPVFRADPSFTTRHLTEFTGVDVEMSWIASHEDVMAFEERWLRAVLDAVNTELGEEIRTTLGAQLIVPEIPFPRVPMAEALQILAERGHVPERRGDLDPAGERMISEYALQQYGHEFVFVTDYPWEVRPFYHMRHPGDPGLTKSYDLLWKGVEITTGAQREHRSDVLTAQALDKGLSLEPIQFYLDFFKYGCPPHGGFGFGLNRMLMVMLNRPNVREVTFLFRGPTRLLP
ncbi:MAG TPA: aspartate--tRNA(Asn) ligase [bacterium]|nr:aspartate--tRNA(Asn) ligase [bacterium]